MKFAQMCELNDKNFRRVSGVKRKTFNRMMDILRIEQVKKRLKGGRPNKLMLEDMLFMTLEYLREYRTYLSIGTSYGLSESNAYHTIRWVEDTLVKSGVFSLPGKKALLDSKNNINLILIDVTESPVERPKKNKKNITQEKGSVIHTKPRLSSTKQLKKLFVCT
jgi:Helix-turn-helix of DDE superfamily endonuclease